MGAWDSLTNAVGNFFGSIASMLETGSWKVEEAADSARDAETLLERVDEEIDQRGQETLDQVDKALTFYGKLQRDQQRLTGQVEDWTKKAKAASDRAKTFEAGSESRTKWVGLTREALEQKASFASQLAVVDQALAAAKPDADKALELVEKVGLTREKALSQRTSLQVANATAQGKLALAEARKTWGKGSGPGQLLEEARKKVDEAMARATAGEMIAQATPASADDVAAEIGRAQAESSVEEELAALMK